MTPIHQRQIPEQNTSQIWIAADYHFPSTYSCRIPMSSANSALVMPAPGPATVRLALIRVGIEVFGEETTREELFPLLCSAAVLIRPPERVAISQQVIRGYKWSEGKHKHESIQESIMVREMAHAAGPMTVFLQIPEAAEQRMHVLLRTIGYWGQSSSFASCMAISHTLPQPGEYAIPLNLVDDTFPLRHYFTCLVTEFRSNQVSWYDVVPGNVRPKTSALRLDHYLWPMIIEYRHGTAKLLVRTPLFEGEM